MITSAGRDSYHHGDLANALALAALDLARTGGPGAVVLREAARKVGVSATAAYRHFAGHDDLMATVKECCQDELVARMEIELAAGTPDPDPGRESIRRLRALGLGYLRFAQEEPGLFRTAFSHNETPAGEKWDHMLDAPAFQQLTSTLDEMVQAGVLDAGHRAQAEIVAWAGVHGLSMLILDGPLGALPAPAREAIADRMIRAILAGVIGRDES